jgi:hydrogenase maturation protease
VKGEVLSGVPFRVLAFGSPHGDDQVGWLVLRRLREQGIPVEMHELAQPLALLEHLEGCQTLLLLDACRSGARPGTITRMDWPEPRLDRLTGASSHGFGVVQTLELAQALGRRLPRIILLGIEVEDCDPGDDLSPSVKEALPQLCQQALETIQTSRERQRPEGRSVAYTSDSSRSGEAR